MEIDDKSKQAVLRHMNADHRLDLGLYLRHVNGLSAAQLAAEGEPEMLDMDLASIRIRTAASGAVHVVPIEPPMASWAERRTRLVSMALEARTACGVPLPEHAPASTETGPAAIPFQAPAGFDWVVIGGVALYGALAVLVYTGTDSGPAGAWSRALSAVGVPPPSSTAAGWLSRWLGGEDGFRLTVSAIFIPVLLIHITEVWWLDRTRLAPHRIRRGSTDWLLWMVSTFFGGVFMYKRFDAAVAAAAKASKAEH